MQESGAELINAGTTQDEVSLGRVSSTGVFIIAMNATSTNLENRWTLPFSIAMHKAFDAIEAALESDPPGTPAALLTISESPKFYSNGIDPAWMASGPPADELNQWNDLTMTAFARPILLPIPTITAVNGHAFGAGVQPLLLLLFFMCVTNASFR
jgi:enoyl-CoA hydratase/carnithine racemase